MGLFSLSVSRAVATSDREPAGEGAARRRRERRLRQWARHEKLSVQEVRVVPHGEVLEARLPQGGSRPPCLGVPRGPQVGLERHVVEDLGELAPFVQILCLPVPQTVDYVADAFRILDCPMAEQAIEVPRISCSPCPSRSPIPEPQSAEQLLEVPTVLSPTRIALRIAEEIVDTPVPQGRGGKRRGQGFLPEQSSTAISSSGKRISERTVEQIVDISPGGGLGQGSSSLSWSCR